MKKDEQKDTILTIDTRSLNKTAFSGGGGGGADDNDYDEIATPALELAIQTK
jgi:hypothetical protein